MADALDDDEFAIREKATQDLQKPGADARFFLRQSLKTGASNEVRARVRRLVDSLGEKEIEKNFDAAKVRKAVMLVVKLGTEKASEALTDLMRLDRETLVATEARQALDQVRAGKTR
jgi:hypothetical protein